jgi:hypothetical protein
VWKVAAPTADRADARTAINRVAVRISIRICCARPVNKPVK